jgi:Holliday junction resolvase RusA-like endonuclease
MLLDLWVPGHARPKGSLNAVIAQANASTKGSQLCPRCRAPLRVYQEEAVKGSSEWKRTVALAVKAKHQGLPFNNPVLITCYFRFARPDSSAERFPTARQYGDLDKLVRNVWDALTDGGFWADDSLAMSMGGSSKTWGDREGVAISVIEA